MGGRDTHGVMRRGRRETLKVLKRGKWSDKKRAHTKTSEES